MSAKPENTEAQILSRIAETEAKLDALKLKLAKVRSKGTGKRAVVDDTGIDELWKAALKKSRSRSSRHLCRTAWNRIPIHERPPMSDVIAALKVFNKTDDWTRDACQYAPKLDRFISERKWEDVPDVGSPMDRYKNPAPKPLPVADPEGTVLSREERRALLGIKKP